MRGIYTIAGALLIISSFLYAQSGFLFPVEGFNGGNVTQIKAYEDTVLCAVRGGGFHNDEMEFYISYDNGENWENTGLLVDDPESFIFNNNTIYFIEDDLNPNIKSYSLATREIKHLEQNNNLSMGFHQGTLFSFSAFGRLLKYDFDKNGWTINQHRFSSSSDSPIISVEDSLLFISVRKKNELYRSGNNGESFQQIENIPDSFAISGIKVHDGVYYAFSAADNRLISSMDKGLNWEFLQGNYPGDKIEYFETSNGIFFTLTPEDRIFVSNDLGITWSQNIDGISRDSKNGLVCTSEYILLATFGGVYKFSSDNNYWEEINSGINNKSVTMLKSINDKLFVGTGGYGLYYLENEQIINVTLPDNVKYVFDIVADGNLLLMTAGENGRQYESKVLASEDNGISWSTFAPDKNLAGINNIIITENYRFFISDTELVRQARPGDEYKLLVLPGEPNTDIWQSASNGESLVINKNGILYFTDDSGETWRKSGYFPGSTGLGTGSNKNYYLRIGGSLYVSNNNGHSWDNYMIPSDVQISTEDFIYFDKNIASIGRNGNIYLMDYKIEYQTFFQNFHETISVNTIMNSGDTYYVGTHYSGLYKIVPTTIAPRVETQIITTTNAFLEWSTDATISDYRVQIFEVADEYLLLLDKNVGNTNHFYYENFRHNTKYAWRVSPVSSNGDEMFSDYAFIEVTSPGKFELRQNYPNPFNNSTTIQFELSTLERATVELYNTPGERVGIITDQVYNSGVHEISFEAKNLSSGIYFLRLTSSENTKTIKMVYMK